MLLQIESTQDSYDCLKFISIVKCSMIRGRLISIDDNFFYQKIMCIKKSDGYVSPGELTCSL